MTTPPPPSPQFSEAAFDTRVPFLAFLFIIAAILVLAPVHDMQTMEYRALGRALKDLPAGSAERLASGIPYWFGKAIEIVQLFAILLLIRYVTNPIRLLWGGMALVVIPLAIIWLVIELPAIREFRASSSYVPQFILVPEVAFTFTGLLVPLLPLMAGLHGCSRTRSPAHYFVGWFCGCVILLILHKAQLFPSYFRLVYFHYPETLSFVWWERTAAWCAFFILPLIFCPRPSWEKSPPQQHHHSPSSTALDLTFASFGGFLALWLGAVLMLGILSLGRESLLRGGPHYPVPPMGAIDGTHHLYRLYHEWGKPPKELQKAFTHAFDDARFAEEHPEKYQELEEFFKPHVEMLLNASNSDYFRLNERESPLDHESLYAESPSGMNDAGIFIGSQTEDRIHAGERSIEVLEPIETLLRVSFINDQDESGHFWGPARGWSLRWSGLHALQFYWRSIRHDELLLAEFQRWLETHRELLRPRFPHHILSESDSRLEFVILNYRNRAGSNLRLRVFYHSWAKVDRLYLAMALDRYRRTHGSYPDELEMLVPEYLARIPLDPLSCDNYGYMRVGNGFLLITMIDSETHRFLVTEPPGTPK